MSRFSLKQVTQRELFDLFLVYLSDYDFNEAIQWYILHEALLQQRYITSRFLIRKSNMRVEILSTLLNNRFWLFARMSRFSFRQIVDLIKDNEVFQNRSHNSHSTIETQLLFVLYKLDHVGNASAFREAAVLWSVSEDHIHLCTRQIIIALYRLRDQYIC